MQANGNDKKVLINTAVDTPTALAYDWVHGILYWADSGLRHGKAKIEAVSVASGHRHALFATPDVDSPRVLAVDPRPDQGYLLIIAIDVMQQSTIGADSIGAVGTMAAIFLKVLEQKYSFIQVISGIVYFLMNANICLKSKLTN